VHFHLNLVGVSSVHWAEGFDPILAMLALSDNQDLLCLWFRQPVDLECAGRILGVVKAVKRQHAEFLCLLIDIINSLDRGVSHANLALILEAVKQAMVFMDEDPITPLLRPMASGVERIQLAVGSPWWLDRTLSEYVTGEAHRIRGVLQDQYAARFVSSTTQLQLLSCARPAALVQPAMGWLRMHEPL
jgi:hypothetical protein